MDIEFMYLDSLEALRPKMEMFKSFDEAMQATDLLYAGSQDSNEGVSITDATKCIRPCFRRGRRKWR